MTPATDRGLSEADWGLINRVFEGLKPVPYGEARASLTPFNTTEGFISALLAAARREGEGASRDHDQSTEKATPQERAPWAIFPHRPGDPVAWRVKDFADGWFYYGRNQWIEADRAQHDGFRVEPLYPDEVMQALNGLVGLCQLLLGRDDLPQSVRDALMDNHRVVEAWRIVGSAEGVAPVIASEDSREGQ